VESSALRRKAERNRIIRDRSYQSMGYRSTRLGSHSFRQWTGYIIDRCRLIATAMLVLAVTSIICMGGLTGVLTLGATVLAGLIWIRRLEHAPRPATYVCVIDDDEDSDEWDADLSRSHQQEVARWIRHADFDDEDFQDAHRSSRSHQTDDTESDPHDVHSGFPSHDDFCDDYSHGFDVNPASGFPMISGNASGVDVAGNFYGFSNDHFGSAMSSSSHGWP